MMRALACGLIAMLSCFAIQASEPQSAIYDEDPAHLVNRLYRAIAVRTEAGIQYGMDSSVPFDEDFDDPERLAAVLDEFLRANGQGQISSDMKRALLLHDVWAAFDLAAKGERRDLRLRLARAVSTLRMPDKSIAGLEDNYAAAVNSGQFGKDFDPAHPDRAFLPPDLFHVSGPWVEIGASGLGLVAPAHVASLSGRSTFRIFIRCPGGRKATIAYLDRLNLHRSPWALVPVEIAIAEPAGRRVRSEPRLDRATPQFPEGTIVALVRQMAVVNSALEPVPTPITQSLQFRVYRRVDASGPANPAFVLTMRRRDLLTGRLGGLHVVTPEETEYQRISKLHGTREVQLRGPVVMTTCRICHGGNGIFSVNSYTRPFGPQTTNPQLLPADSANYQAIATMEWKKQQFDWGLLRGLVEAGR